MAKKSPAKQKSPSFEDAIEQLKATVHELEGGNLSLTDSLECYEAGIRNLKLCYQSLKKAEQKIELLVSLDDQGQVETKSFDDAATFVEPEAQIKLAKELDDELNADNEQIDDSSRLF
jgi:exodeoxyribonuclease VII small subunit